MGTREMDFGRKEFRDLKAMVANGTKGSLLAQARKGGPRKGV